MIESEKSCEQLVMEDGLYKTDEEEDKSYDFANSIF